MEVASLKAWTQSKKCHESTQFRGPVKNVLTNRDVWCFTKHSHMRGVSDCDTTIELKWALSHQMDWCARHVLVVLEILIPH